MNHYKVVHQELYNEESVPYRRPGDDDVSYGSYFGEAPKRRRHTSPAPRSAVPIPLVPALPPPAPNRNIPPPQRPPAIATLSALTDKEVVIEANGPWLFEMDKFMATSRKVQYFLLQILVSHAEDICNGSMSLEWTQTAKL